MRNYKIVNAGSSDELQDMVNEEIKNGYVPLGGVAFAMGTYGQQYSQALFGTPTKSNTGPR